MEKLKTKIQDAITECETQIHEQRKLMDLYSGAGCNYLSTQDPGKYFVSAKKIRMLEDIISTLDLMIDKAEEAGLCETIE